MSRPAPWYQDAIIYELRVGAFSDSNGDGIGDFPGLTSKLDYLQDLGVTALWLLPFYPSPLKDDGYDISDYRDVRADAGTLQDFRVFVREAHARNLKVITELVLNHTSDQHPWFQRARSSPPGSRWRDFYVWSDTPDRYAEARIIFKDTEISNWAWDPVAKAYYWHRFYTSQPDLNFDNPAVRRAMCQVVDFWFGLGVDGLRLDAVPYLFERDGTNCENLPETHTYLRTLRRHVDHKFKNRMLLSEANQWPEDAVAYFGNGDESHMAFHFPIMPRLFMALHMEDRYPIVDIINQTPPIPETAQWALFLRNHDELTLEMVTDEERDYMYRVYANDTRARINLGIRRRLSPLLGSDRRRIELMNGLLCSLPGTPILYYGDEIGMGDNVYLGDRNGVRTPMQWSADRNAGFSRANPQRLYLPVIIDPEFHYETVNVEAQESNRHSLLWWMRRLIALRAQYTAFGRGTLEFLYPRNGKVLVFVRREGDQRLLVVANLSRFAQFVELDLSAFKGLSAIELFGGTVFPPIGELPYLLTLGPHSFYWFSLAPSRPSAAVLPPPEAPVLDVEGEWGAIFQEEEAVERLEHVLPRFLVAQPWYSGRAFRLSRLRVTDAVRMPLDGGEAFLVFVSLTYQNGTSDSCALPLAFATERLDRIPPAAQVARLRIRRDDQTTEGVLYDALGEPALHRVLLQAIARRRRFKGAHGTLAATVTTVGRGELSEEALSGTLVPAIDETDRASPLVTFGERFVLKLLRRLDEGVSPDLELGRYLTDRGFPNTPSVLGSIEYRPQAGEPPTVGVLRRFIPHEGDAWRYTLDEVERYFERALIVHRDTGTAELPPADLLALSETARSEPAGSLMGGYLETARLLGTRTAELHMALADSTDPAFVPEPFSRLYQRSLYQSMRNLLHGVFHQLEERIDTLTPAVTAQARAALGQRAAILKAFQPLTKRRISSLRIRCHGDYHLGQLLFTGKDFAVIHFGGPSGRPLSERRIKRSPLRDVAGMLYSFHAAAYTVYGTRLGDVIAGAAPVPAALEPWAMFWYRWSGSAFLRSYLKAVSSGPLVPHSREDLAVLLDVMVLEKTLEELSNELSHRPDWTWLPLRILSHQMDAARRE